MSLPEGAGRSAQAAIVAALAVVQSGRRIVADIELKTSFDRVNHDILIDRLGRTITDRWMIRLVRASLDPGVMDSGIMDAGIMDSGTMLQRVQGTPQGGSRRRFWPMGCLMRWTRNWSAVAEPSSAMWMMRPSLSAATRQAGERASGSCVSGARSRDGCA
jgi:RNA-directed DNA polymerase